MNKYQKLAQNTAVFFISDFASKVLVFLLLPLYTSCLTTGQYGVSDLLATTVMLLSPVFTLCISQASLRFAMSKDTDLTYVFSIGLKIIFLGTVLLLACSPLVLSYTAIKKEYLILFYLLYLANSLDAYCSQFARAIDRVVAVGISGILKTIITIGANIMFLVVFRFGIVGYILSYILAYFVSVVFLTISCRLGRFIAIKGYDGKLTREMLRYSLPLIPNSLSWWLNNYASRYIILFYMGAGVQGLFAAASKIPIILTTVQGIFTNAWQLSAINEYEAVDRDAFFSGIYKLYNIGMIFCASGLILFAKIISKILFSAAYYEAWKFVPFLLLSVVFGAMSGFLGSVFAASKKNATLFVSTLVGGIVAVVCSILFIPLIGGVGAAVASALSNAIVWAIRLYKSRAYVRLDIDVFHSVTGYILLVVQSVCANLCSTEVSYFISVMIVITLFLLNIKQLKRIWDMIIATVRKRLGKAVT